MSSSDCSNCGGGGKFDQVAFGQGQDDGRQGGYGSDHWRHSGAAYVREGGGGSASGLQGFREWQQQGGQGGRRNQGGYGGQTQHDIGPGDASISVVIGA
jgi:hypothetical protein